jgi:hypothetical protein
VSLSKGKQSDTLIDFILASCERSEAIQKADIHWIASSLRFSQ